MLNLFINKPTIWSSQSEHLHLLEMKRKFFFGACISLFSILTAFAQEGFEYAPPDNIKTVQFFGSEKIDNFPVVSLGDKIILLFDDLNGDEADYYYKIKHFNHNWTPSNLFQNEYIEGYDNLRINDYSTSFNTLQTFTNYRLELPNENIQFKVSGNYILEVYDELDTLIFSRRFCLYDSQASVQAAVYRPQNMSQFNTHQSLHFAITPYQGVFRNPEQNIYVHLIQNRQWDTDLLHLSLSIFLEEPLNIAMKTLLSLKGVMSIIFSILRTLELLDPI